MKKIFYYLNFILIFNLIFVFSACSQPSSSGSDSDSADEEELPEGFDPFAETTWYGDLYKDDYDENMHRIYVKDGSGDLFRFRPASEKTDVFGKEMGYVEILNPVYFLFPKDYEAVVKSGNENAYQLLKDQKITYTVEKNEKGYEACIGILGEQFRLTISKADSKEGTIKWTAGGYLWYGSGKDEIRWNFNDTLPRTIYKKVE